MVKMQGTNTYELGSYLKKLFAKAYEYKPGYRFTYIHLYMYTHTYRYTYTNIYIYLCVCIYIIFFQIQTLVEILKDFHFLINTKDCNKERVS